MPKLSLTMDDAYGRSTKRIIELKPQVLHADLVTNAQAIVNRLQDVTDLGVVRADIILDGDVTGFAATAGSNVDVGGTFTGWIEGTQGKKASLKVPGIKPTLVDADGSIPLTGNTDVYLASWVEGAEIAFLSDGEHIASWIRGTLDR